MSVPARRATLVLLLLVVGLAGCGSDDEERSSTFDPFTDVREQPADAEIAARRAAPRWEAIRTLRGSGRASRSFTVQRGAIQWRARWRCDTGRLGLAVRSRGAQSRPLTEVACPREGEDTGFRTGPLTLDVQASGPWRVVLEQQVDTALHEPPLMAMRSPQTRLLARGRFYDIERIGRGTASLYRLPDDRLALRLAGGFVTAANTDLFVWLSRASRPRNTVEAARAPHVVLREIKSTLGEQNYVLPADVDAEDVRSIVIWCEPVRIAYTAAMLRRR